MTGIVRFYNDEKNMGFITHVLNEREYGEDFFVHRNVLQTFTPAFPLASLRLHTGEFVEFKVDTAHTPSHGQRPRALVCRGVRGFTLQCEHGEVTFSSYSKINERLFPQRRGTIGMLADGASAGTDNAAELAFGVEPTGLGTLQTTTDL